jgi:hypothetical protein
VTLKDRTGTTRSATTGADGTFVLDTGGLAPPFLLRVALPGGGALFGVATEAGVANLTPFTDLILRTWYEVQGADLPAAFDSLGPSTPVPTAVEVALLERLLRRALALWLERAGLDAGTFDLLATPFAADGTGIDGVLDGTTVAPDGSSFTVSDGTTTQTSSVSVSEISGSVTLDTSVTSPSGESESTDGTTLPGEDALAQAVAGVLGTMEKFRAKVNSRGPALAASDLESFLAPGFRDEGLGPTEWAAENATGLRGVTMGEPTLRAVRSWDPAAGVLALDLEVPFTFGGGTQVEVLDMAYRKVGSSWLLHGDQWITSASFGAAFQTDFTPGGVVGPRKAIKLDVSPPVGTVQSVTLSGGGIFDHAPLTKHPGTRLVTWHPTPTTELVHETDMFFLGQDLAEFPAPGTEFLLTVTPVSGTPVVYTLRSGGTTTETVQFLEPTGHSLALDAHPGTPLTARWTRPTTFAVAQLEFSGTSRSASYSEDVRPEHLLRSATEGTLTLPATIGGEAVTYADVYLSFEGPHGELIILIHDFQ